jgi:hypothetical protein
MSLVMLASLGLAPLSQAAAGALAQVLQPATLFPAGAGIALLALLVGGRTLLRLDVTPAESGDTVTGRAATPVPPSGHVPTAGQGPGGKRSPGRGGSR